MKIAITLLVVGILSGSAFALDPGSTVGVGGRFGMNATPAGHGFPSNGLSSPGPTSASAGGRGVSTSVGAGGSVNPGSGGNYNNIGVSFKATVGKGRTTMETVPGRSPTYINVVSGKRAITSLGSIGP